MSNEKPNLPFHDLAERHTGVTRVIGDCYTEAARVCLDRHHKSPIDFKVDDNGKSIEAITNWTPADDRTKAAWANEIDTTEGGAYACALAAIELTKGMVAVRRAETKTGADYYIAALGSGLEDLENCYRLEVSGVDAGSVSVVQQRLQVKLKQAKSGVSNLPAIATVVGFLVKLVLIQPLEEK